MPDGRIIGCGYTFSFGDHTGSPYIVGLSPTGQLLYERALTSPAVAARWRRH